MKIEPAPNGVKVTAFDKATPFYLLSASADCEPQHIWYRNFFLPIERNRALEDREDHLLAALFRVRLDAQESVTFVLTTEENTPLDGTGALATRKALEQR